MFEANLEQNLEALMRDLKRGQLDPKPLRRLVFPKAAVNSVRRVAQFGTESYRRSKRLLLEPIFEPLFHDSSFRCRPGRNCHQAVARVLELQQKGYIHVLDTET